LTLADESSELLGRQSMTIFIHVARASAIMQRLREAVSVLLASERKAVMRAKK
jgi:hypothetical protein